MIRGNEGREENWKCVAVEFEEWEIKKSDKKWWRMREEKVDQMEGEDGEYKRLG